MNPSWESFKKKFKLNNPVIHAYQKPTSNASRQASILLVSVNDTKFFAHLVHKRRVWLVIFLILGLYENQSVNQVHFLQL